MNSQPDKPFVPTWKPTEGSRLFFKVGQGEFFEYIIENGEMVPVKKD